MSNIPKGQRPIDLLMAANEERLIEHIFDLPVSDKKTYKCKITATDFHKISGDEDIIYELMYDECRNEGLENLPVNEAKWDVFIKVAVELRRANLKQQNENKPKEEQLSKKEMDKKIATFRDEVEKDKPVNLADQKAREKTKDKSIRYIVPKYIRDAETGDLMFPTKEEREKFLDLMMVNGNLTGIIFGAYVELMNKIKEVKNKVKN